MRLFFERLRTVGKVLLVYGLFLAVDLFSNQYHQPGFTGDRCSGEAGVGKFPRTWATNATELDDRTQLDRTFESPWKRHEMGLQGCFMPTRRVSSVSAEFAGVLRQETDSRS